MKLMSIVKCGCICVLVSLVLLPWSSYGGEGDMTIDGNLKVTENLTVDKHLAIGDGFSVQGAAYVIVKATDDETQNGQNLLDAYTYAAGLTPHGKARSADNRVVVIVAPGRYDMGTGQLVMNQEHIDLVGLSPVREDQHILGESSGPGSGVLRQTANNVRIENLFVECTRNSGGLSLDENDPAAYFPDSNKPGTIIRNCEFKSDDSNALAMRASTITYAGKYERCKAGDYSFGGGTMTMGDSGTASGTFKDCSGGMCAFGGFGFASGTFRNCVGGIEAFGGGVGMGASGKFYGCRMTGGSWVGRFYGLMDGCEWNAGIRVDDGAKLYRTTINGDVTAEVEEVSAEISDCRITGSVSPNINNIGISVFGSILIPGGDLLMGTYTNRP